MKGKMVKLYDRLPEIYRIKDEGQSPPDQLKNYLGLVDGVFDAIHENIESLYDDLFIETCDDWVIPYIADMLGTSHLSGTPWTLRADVADTIALRRRKGTLGAIEKLTYDLTQWGVHCTELRESLVWNQHLNHQRPDAGGKPAYGHISDIKDEDKVLLRTRAIRGGTVNLRDPALLSLINTPFDQFAHIGDMRPADFGNTRYNLPDLAVFLWRLKDYRIRLSKPKIKNKRPIKNSIGTYILRINVHPMGEPLILFNVHRLDPIKDRPVLTEITELTRIDETPGPIPAARLTKGPASGNFHKYVDIKMYSSGSLPNPAQDRSEVGLQLNFPSLIFPGETLDNWSIRGANLCAWEKGLIPPLMNREIAIDPDIGRIVIGVKDIKEWTDLNNSLIDPIIDQFWLTYTYGAVGPVGAHPVSRLDPPDEEMGEKFMTIKINLYPSRNYDLNDALANLHLTNDPLIIEIDDSATHELDLGSMRLLYEDGGFNLKLNRSLIIRATSYQRPVIKLFHPLRFRPVNVNDAAKITVRLEGLYITRHEKFKNGEPLIGRAAINRLEIINCTLDPGGSKKLDNSPYGSRTKIHTSIVLKEPYGLKDQDEEDDFDQTPHILIERSITGPLKIDTGYTLSLCESIIDAGSGVNVEPAKASFALTGTTNNSWGPPTEVESITIFGKMRVESIKGEGGIWTHALEVLDNQKGCIKFSYFSGEDNERLPQHHGCVSGKIVRLVFTSEVFGNPAYGQLAHSSDFQIRERGPDDDAMGAFGFMKEAYKWRNIQIRFREFMPVGVKLLMIPVT